MLYRLLVSQHNVLPAILSHRHTTQIGFDLLQAVAKRAQLTEKPNLSDPQRFHYDSLAEWFWGVIPLFGRAATLMGHQLQLPPQTELRTWLTQSTQTRRVLEPVIRLSCEPLKMIGMVVEGPTRIVIPA